MSTLGLIAIIVLALLLALALGGAIAGRRRRSDPGEFAASLEDVNRAQALAHAQDKGWDPAVVAQAARAAFIDARPGNDVASLTLTVVLDEPGTDQDKAVFRVTAADGVHELTLGRRAGDWVLDGIS